MRQLERAAGGSGAYSGSGSPAQLQLSPRPQLPVGAAGTSPGQAQQTPGLAAERGAAGGAEAGPSGGNAQTHGQQPGAWGCQGKRAGLGWGGHRCLGAIMTRLYTYLARCPWHRGAILSAV